ncbi:uncharacterized protein MG328 homolog [Mytilus edulis]|uniref:uncharacterized protein MG328 homolog n=1 Tax=Mytilus edulis TaxID=6550 RepID=UPI0039EF9A70
MMMFRSVLFVSSVSIVYGFLLNNNINPNPQISGQQTGANNQVLTITEFYDAKTILQNKIDDVRHETETARHETEDLRHDVDSKLSLVTSQLQQMFSAFQQQLTKDLGQYETNRSQDMERKYTELARNHTQLQENFNVMKYNFGQLQQNCNAMKDKYQNQTIELLSLKNNVVHLSDRVDDISQCKNKTMELEKAIVELKVLKSIQPLRDFSVLKQQVQTITSQTHVLSINDRARSEDFRALHNLTVNSMNQISTRLNEQNISTEARFQNTDSRHNASFATLIKDVHKSEFRQNATLISIVNSLENNLTLTIGNVQQAVSKINNRVAVTACSSSGDTKSSGYVVKFDDVRAIVGVKNISSFRTSGQFTSEVEGLYLVSVWIDTTTNYGHFQIYKNQMIIGSTVFNYISTSATVQTTGTAVVAVELQIGDTVRIQTAKSMYIAHSKESCFTIAKLN